MYNVKQLTENLYWIGGNDRRLALFENVYPIPQGVSYNSYLSIGEETILFDTVDHAVSGIFLENIAHLLDGRKLDYIVVNHMEPDHCATLGDVVLRYPEVKIITNAKVVGMIKQFFDFDIDSRVQLVKEGDTLTIGGHTYAFVMAPMVHWPEVMVTFDATDGILFSADAFGTFGAVGGSIFAEDVDFAHTQLDEARRYYTNIVGKYGPQVLALLKKAGSLDIKMICPLHGWVIRGELIGWFVEKYSRWAGYVPEDEGVLIVYGSVYGGTENAAEMLAGMLAEKGVKKVEIYDASVTHPSYLVAKAFQYSHLVFAASTYNAGVFTPVETLLTDLSAHSMQGRTVGLIQNGSWAPMSGKLMGNTISAMKNMTVLEPVVTLRSTVSEKTREELETLSETIAASLHK